MVTPQMIAYIKTEREKKLSDKEIKAHLLAVGWNELDIEQALTQGMPTTELLILKSYRSKKKWKIFCFWAILLLIGLAWSFVSPVNPELSGQMTGNILQFSILTVLAYVIAYGLTSNALPKGGSAREVWDTILKICSLFFIEAGIVLVFLLGLAFVFAR
jgi:hypothetical protein